MTTWLGCVLFLNPAGNVMSNTLLGVTQSVVERGQVAVYLAFPTQAMDTARVGSSTFSGLPLGPSLLAVLCYAPAQVLARVAPLGWHRPYLVPIDPQTIRASGASLPENYRFRTPLLIYWLQIVAAATLSAAALSIVVVLSYLLAERFRLPLASRLLVAGTAAFGTSLFPHAITFGKEPFGTAAAFAAVAALLLDRRPWGDRRWRLAGLLIGIAVLMDYWTVVVAGLLFAYAVGKAGIRAASQVLIGLVGPMALLLLYHTAVFGAPWLTPYDFRYIERWAEHRAGLAGLTGPHAQALWGLTFSPFQGVFLYHPFLLAALWVVLRSWRAPWRDETAFALGVFAALVLMASSAGRLLTWSGGFVGWGPRHLVTATPFLVLLLTLALARARRAPWPALLTGLIVLSIGVQLLCAAWGGTGFPEAVTPARVFMSDTRALEVNPLAVMVSAVMHRGFSAAWARAYAPSDAVATAWTLLAAAVAVGVSAWMWRPILQAGRRTRG